MFVKGTVGKVFDPLGKWGKRDCENWVLRPSFLSIPPIFSLFSAISPHFSPALEVVPTSSLLICS